MENLPGTVSPPSGPKSDLKGKPPRQCGQGHWVAISRCSFQKFRCHICQPSGSLCPLNLPQEQVEVEMEAKPWITM